MMRPSDNAIETADVVVIGAGLAGLRAAGELIGAGVDTIVLEATSRVGGRVFTDDVLGDLGATWFHGTLGNVAYDIALGVAAVDTVSESDSDEDDVEGINEVKSNRDSDSDVSSAHTPGEASSSDSDESNNGRDWKTHPAAQYLGALDMVRVLSDGTRKHVSKTVTHEALRVIAQAAQSVDEAVIARSVDDGVSIRSALMARLPTRRPELLSAVYRLWERFDSSVFGAASTDDVSAARDDEYVELAGNHVRPHRERGMEGAVVLPLATKLPDGSIRLNTPVVELRWGEDDGVCVVTTGGEIRARVVIWTPSINVTKAWCGAAQKNIAEAPGTFDPALPCEKRTALEETGMAPVAKVMMILRQAPSASARVKSGHSLGVIWGNGNECVEVACAACTAAKWAHGVGGVYYEEKPRPCVSVWLTGRPAVEFECGTASSRAREASAVLSLVFGERVEVIRAGCGLWAGNEYVRGGYSFPLVGARRSRIENLMRPVEAHGSLRITFAGEAVHPMYYSTMHGAIESGLREARRCIRFLEGRDWRLPHNVRKAD